jgi:hypothetical protein
MRIFLVCIYVCMHCVYVYVYAYVHVHVYVYVHVCVYVYVYVHVYVYVYMCMSTYLVYGSDLHQYGGTCRPGTPSIPRLAT